MMLYFYFQFVDQTQFYRHLDIALLLDIVTDDVVLLLSVCIVTFSLYCYFQFVLLLSVCIVTFSLYCYFQFVDQTQFYLPLDIALLLDMFKTDIQYLGKWKMLGRPTIILPIRQSMLGTSLVSSCVYVLLNVK